MKAKEGADYWINCLGLTEHPEGGYFKETYRSDESMKATALPDRYGDARDIGTSIYFLLTSEKVSNFHRLNSDEIWHYHTGGVARIHIISPQGKYYFKDIGPDHEQEQSFQVCIPRHSWFAAEVVEKKFILVGCTVAPAFDFADFELAQKNFLIDRYPEMSELINRFTVK